MKPSKTTLLTQAAAIAAVYVVLTRLFAPLSYGPIQVRLSEALTVLPYFTSAAVPGLTIGCVLGNLVLGAPLPDIIFGSLATLIGAILSYQLRKHKLLVPVPPILANALIVPFVLRFAYAEPLPIPFMMLTVGLGEIISCGVIGLILLLALERYGSALFRQEA